MHSVFISIVPTLGKASAEFLEALKQAMKERQRRFVYMETTFHMRYDHVWRLKSLKVVLEGLDAEPPLVLTSGELPGAVITLRSSFPTRLHAKPGCYVGATNDFPGVHCWVDPQGVKNDGVAQLYAVGTDFASVIAFFRKVMTGKLSPGRKNDPWDPKAHR